MEDSITLPLLQEMETQVDLEREWKEEKDIEREGDSGSGLE